MEIKVHPSIAKSQMGIAQNADGDRLYILSFCCGDPLTESYDHDCYVCGNCGRKFNYLSSNDEGGTFALPQDPRMAVEISTDCSSDLLTWWCKKWLRRNDVTVEVKR